MATGTVHNYMAGKLYTKSVSVSADTGVTFTDPFQFVRCGNIVTMFFTGNVTYPDTNTYHLLFVIPEGYRPMEKVTAYLDMYVGAERRGTSRIRTPNNVYQVYGSADITTTSTASCTCTWITTDPEPTA